MHGMRDFASIAWYSATYTKLCCVLRQRVVADEVNDSSSYKSYVCGSHSATNTSLLSSLRFARTIHAPSMNQVLRGIIESKLASCPHLSGAAPVSRQHMPAASSGLSGQMWT